MESHAFIPVSAIMLLSTAAVILPVVPISARVSNSQVFMTNPEALLNKMTTCTPNTTQTLSPFSLSFLPTIHDESNHLAQTTVTVDISSLPQSSSGARRLSAGAVVGIIIAIANVIIFATGFFVLRRRRRPGHVISDLNDPIDISSPTYDNKEYIPDPFLTDLQAEGLGIDTPQQVTRRIGAQFIQIDSRSTSRGNSESTSHPSRYIPHALIEGDGETTGSSLSSEYRPHSLTSHATSTQYSIDITTSLGPRRSSREFPSDSSVSAVLVSDSMWKSRPIRAICLFKMQNGTRQQAEITHDDDENPRGRTFISDMDVYYTSETL